MIFMKLNLVLFLCLLVSPRIFAQFTVGSASIVKVGGQLSVGGGLNNASTLTDLSSAQVFLTGGNQTIMTGIPMTVLGLTIDGGGTKTLSGEWTLLRDLVFNRGIVSVSSGKLLYTGSTILQGNPDAYVNGTLFQRGAGVRFFPVGEGTTYMPMSLNDVQDAATEIGVTPVTTRADLELPLDVNSIANRYWQLTASGGTVRSSSASLYFPGSSIDASQQLVVVQADDANGATAVNLGGGIQGDFVTSFVPVTKPVLTLGVGDEVNILIRDLITPYFDDGVNDQLHIVNIEFTVENKVTLMDRWGLVVKQWKNFRNEEAYDFSQFSPGNYICVLEYQLTPEAGTKKMSQMVTILKGN
jgi:hypothetical protein